MVDGMMQKAEIFGADERSVNRRLMSPYLGDLAEWLCKAISRVVCTRRKALRFSALPIFFCLLPSFFCHAEELTDPTRPPAPITAPVPASGVEAAPAPAGLQSIIISKNRRAAIIDGETVELGGKHGDAKLIEVNEGGVVLRGAQGRQVMTLFPGVKMTPVKVPVENKEQKLKTTPQSSKSQAQPGNKKAKQPATGEKK